MLLVWLAFICVVAAYIPGNIKRVLKHPMLVGVKLWALAHLLANGDLGSIILFGSLLAWAVYDRISLKHRTDPGGRRSRTAAGSTTRGGYCGHYYLFCVRLCVSPAVDRRPGLRTDDVRNEDLGNVDLRMILSENRYPPRNASGAGFFGIMREDR